MSWWQAEWFCISRWPLAAIPPVALAFFPAASRAQSVPIDRTRSTVTVRVYKSGLFSGLAHDHVIQAPIASGSLDAHERTVELSFNVADMKVLDSEASDSERKDIDATMKGPKVPDMAQFPAIGFASTSVSASGADRSQVTGTVKLHGAIRQVSVPVVLHDGKYTGSVTLKQTDYGITPVKIAGGAVRVKDEIVVEFSVAPTEVASGMHP